jgi:hypothetical protein
LGLPLVRHLLVRDVHVLRCDKARKHRDSALLDEVIVVALAERRSPHLGDREEAAVDAELERHALQA